MSSKVIILLRTAKRHGINISISKGELQLKLSKANSIDPQLLQNIKDNKEEIIDFLTNSKWKSSRINGSEKSLAPYDRDAVKRIPLSFGQERLWFIDQLEGTVQYHVPAVLRLTGNLNRKGLDYALQTVIHRHESLRSVIFEEQGEPYQQVMDVKNWALSIAEGHTYKNDGEAFSRYMHQLIAEPFNLSRDYMLRATLVCLGEKEHVLVVIMHHIASDGWSVPIIVKEVSELYESYVQGRPHQLPSLDIQYADFAIWQRDQLRSTLLESKLEYWKEKLQGVASLQLPTDFPRPAIQSNRGGLSTFGIDQEVISQMASLGHSEGATLFMTLLTAFKVLLFRYSGQQDICVGSPIAGRQHEEVEELIGFFVNTLALRTQVNDEAGFTDLLQAVKQTTIEAYEHQEVPFEKVVETVVKERDISRSPLFQVMFVLQNTRNIPQLRLPDLTLSTEKLENKTSKFDIIFNVTETTNGLYGSVEYCSDLYREETISRMIGHYKNLLASIIKSPHQAIGMLSMLSAAEEEELLVTFNDTTVGFPSEKSIAALFEEQVLKTPQADAVVFDDGKITYKELNERANMLAHHLRRRGVAENTLVPICIERSINMVIGVVAILKAGAAYVPVDPDYPLERILYMIGDIKASLILTTKADKAMLPAAENIAVIEIDSDWSEIAKEPIDNPVSFYQPHHLAYLLYTSGSTGRPKGVKMHGGALVNLLHWQEKQFVNKHRRVLQFASLNFDASFQDMFSTLCYGSTLYLISEERRKDAAELLKDLVKYKITHLFIPYIVLKNIAENIVSLPHSDLQLEEVITAGEQLKMTDDILLLLKKKNIGSLVNAYGPTEAHVVSSYTINMDDVVPVLPPIGKPIDNTQLYILGKRNQLVPVGVAGELYIGGVQVAQGYLNKPEQTAEKFNKDIFSKDPEAKLYRTGDIARWLPDGNIEYLGRIDDQVKIRGFRIELGEIESILQECSLVRQAVVLAKEDYDGQKRLVAYVVSQDVFDKHAIISYLKDKVPYYMVPAFWVEMESLPITSNGKINKRALPEPNISGLIEYNYVAPRFETEKVLAEIWQRLLSIERVGINDNFFELGGHSLLAIRLMSAIRRELKVEIAIKELFLHPTIAALASVVQSQDKRLLVSPIEAVMPRPVHIPLSFSQERLWFIDRLEGSVQYHLPSVLRLLGELDKNALAAALQWIVNRHEVLRTVITEHQGKGYQSVKEQNGWILQVTDGSAYKENNEALRNYIFKQIETPFDLSKDYMLRAELISIDRQDHVLVTTMHHIAGDGWSTSIIVKELAEIYAAFAEGRPVELPALKIQYADYAIWQRNYLQGDVLASKLEYWKKRLTGVATLQLPTDYKRPTVQSTRGSIAKFFIEKELTEQLKRLSQQQGATLFMTLLAAFKVVLQRYSGQHDICVGTPIAGRNRQEVEILIGLFINTLALRSDLSNNPSFTNLLQQVKATTLEAYANQEVPFEKVVDAVGNERDMSRNPLFQVLFTMQNTPEIPELRLGKIMLSAEEFEPNTSQLDIICNITETQLGMRMSVVYCTDLFTERTIRQMVAHFTRLLASVVKSPYQHIGSLAMLSNQEQHRLLAEFNDTKAVLPDKTIITLFEEQVVKTPANVAIIFKEQQLTFEQLNAKANQLAHYLKARGVREEQLVAVCLENSADILVVILGILKAGAAYVPLDPAYPEDRTSYIMEDSASTVVICNAETEAKMPGDPAIRLILIDGDWQLISLQPQDDLQARISSHHLAYVIYTSGSTGRPKGVMIEHKSLFNYLLNNKAKYINESASVAGSFVHLSFTFDASLTGIFMPLLSGKSVVISSRQSVHAFEDSNLHKYAPYDFIKITPSHLDLLQSKIRLANGELLTPKLVIGGEALLRSQFNYLIEEGININIVNEYGPTEATVGCSVYSFDTLRDKERYVQSNSVSVGKPIDNVKLYILGENNELLPVGVPGELCIGGAGLARGYLNSAGLTAEKFIKNPFSQEVGSRLYKTGDMATWDADGNISYLGRKDDQVKINGYRVELGEIESVIQQYSLVLQAAVVARENKDGSKRLIAYVVPNEGFDKDEIISYLKTRLPEYMIPAQWIAIEKMPLTINGKVNRKALPDPDISALSENRYVAPKNEIEETLAKIWQHVLELDQVGVEDDFFDLGGHSLLAIRLISVIRKSFGVEMQISDIFNCPTISLLADRLQKTPGTTVLPSIEMVYPRPNRIPLSYNQERLWFIDQLQGSVQYHVPAVLRLKGSLHTGALSFAFRQIINRHEILRTVILEKEGHAYQRINDKGDWQLNIEDGDDYKENKTGLQQRINQLINKPFDLARDYMVRANLIRLNNTESILLITLHHLASDAWSIPVMVKEITELYQSYVEGRPFQLEPLKVQYADFAIWQRNYLQGQVLENKLAFWKENLQDVTPLQLPTDYARPIMQSSKGAFIKFSIDNDLADGMQQLSRKEGTSLFMAMLAVFKVLLFRYSGQQDICVGTPIAGRQQQELEALMGFFLNTLVLRSKFSESISYKELLDQVRSNTLKAYEHQEVPFEKVVEAVVKERDISRSPLFQVMFIMQNIQRPADLRLGETVLSLEATGHDTTKFDLTFGLEETPGGLYGWVEYCSDLYREETISRMIGHYKNLLASIIKSPHQAIGMLSMLSAAEEEELLVTFNDTTIDYPSEKSIAALFEEQVLKTPQTDAVVFDDGRITYKELNERANMLAHHLRRRGVAENTLVPICIERSINMVIGVVAILKAGAAYVPVDPDYPLERILYMIEDIKANLILTTKADKAMLPAAENIAVIEIDSDWPEIAKEPLDNPVSLYHPHHLAYLLYTSGSTGRPKGVKMHGGALVNLLHWQEKQFVNKHRRVLQFASLNFDASFQDMFSTLCYGSTLYLISEERRKDAAELLKDLVKYKITHLFIPYIVLKNIAENIVSLPHSDLQLEEVITAGEQLKMTDDILLLLKKKNIGSIVNEYGPTEAHVVSSYTLDTKSAIPALPPIGKPIDNTQLYILGEGNQLVPMGVAGELYIGGVQVAQGYLNKPEQTAEKFIPDFFNKDPKARLYKTGDIARWLPDGNIEYLGRIDDQVKIRGFRIELGEIESILQECSLVRQAVVLAKEDYDGQKRLVGYVVPNGSFNREGITDYLKSRLPGYMVPALWVEMTSLPITSNGKINKRALPEPDISGLIKNNYVAPTQAVEKVLAEIWQRLLALERIGINDNFFELGGHSLLATRVVSVIRKQMEVEMSIKDLFIYPTIAGLAQFLQLQHKGLALPSIETVQNRPPRIRLSFSQERLWFIHQLEGSMQYHVPSVLRLKGKLNKAALSYSLQMVVGRHETLRTIFREEEGQAYQYIKDKDGWRLSVVDGSSFKTETNRLAAYIDRLIMKPFDLSKDYMMRATLVTLDEEDHILVVTMHHIASDGWSTSVIVNELVELYSAFVEDRPVQLPALNIQYADYAIWQRTYLKGEVFNKKLAYWKSKLEGVATLQLPTDFSRPPVWSTRGATESFKINKELVAKLHELSRVAGSTLFMTLLAAFKTLLYRYSGQQDICVGTPIAGRQQHELESLIGFFVNTLALRTEVTGETTFTALLQQVRTVTMEAYENQEVPFEKVVDEVVKERDISRNPLFQVMFVMLNLPDIPLLHLNELTFSAEEREHKTAKFDLQVFIAEQTDGIEMQMEYCTDLFTSATIKRMMGHYMQLLSSIVKDPDKQISSFAMLAIAEEQQLLIDLNNTKVNYPDKNIVNLFEEQVLKTPDAVAIIFGERQLTYRELNQRSNQLAHLLRMKGIKEEMLVTVCLERSLQMIVAIWGILKAGAAYVPIDPEYPQERIGYMLDDTAASLLITTSSSRKETFLAKNVDILELDDDFLSIEGQPASNLNLTIHANHLAYVIYTSGSTGKPKGAMNEHGALANRLFWAQDYFNLTNEDVVLQKTSFSFDVSVWELLWPSLVGAKLVFAKPGGQKDNDYLKSVIANNKVSVLHFVPSMLGVFLPDLEDDDCGSLRKVLCSGEALTPSHVKLFKEKLPSVRLYNLYGPTEAAIDVTCWPLTDKESDISVIPIGKPVSNTSIYILDDSGGMMPLGGIGEIHIGGIQVARGYLNRPELTAQKFITDRFNKQLNSKLYKTGDLARWMPDGNIEYLGRKDEQVKIRGYRIEPGEIEAVLQEDELVNQAVVLAKTDKSGNTRLVSYFVPDWTNVKTKERELYHDRITNWKELYDTEYSQAISENVEEELNLIGWNSSFTGEAILESEMKQWVDDIVTVILLQQPQNVLEIGCGTGLIYYPLAGKVKKYIGTDLSEASILRITERISKEERTYGPTELKVCAAHEIMLPASEQVDTIILNSIVQYFPGEDYLNTVLDKCFSILKGNGRIIIGDVRDDRLLELFKGRLQANILQDAVSIREFKWAVEQELIKENELCIHPAYFFKLQERYPVISHVEIQWKQADYINELSLYRYTVVVHLNIETEPIEPGWQEWEHLTDVELLIDQLREHRNTIAIKNAPNPRLWKEKALRNALQNKLVSTVGGLLLQSDKQDNETARVASILDIASTNGYHYRLLLNEDPLKVNIILEPVLTGRLFQQPYEWRNSGHKTNLTNIPLFVDISRQMQKDIRLMLLQKLPEYMVPVEIIAAREIPLTANGKGDRKFLSQLEERSIINAEDYLPPSTIIEHLLVTIWKELLGLGHIGINDNFFELGGDSILTIQVVSRLKRLGYALQPKDVFIHQTISKLSSAIAERSGSVVVGEQSTLSGQSGILPIQQWYLDSEQSGVTHFNQSVLLGINKLITGSQLSQAIEILLEQHDALRFRYYRQNNEWKQEYGNNKGEVLHENLQSTPLHLLGSVIAETASAYQQSLNIENGEIIRIVWMQTPASEINNRLLIVVHHLAIDGVSWRILLDDLEMLLTALKKGEKPVPGIKTSSYNQWYNALVSYGERKKLLSQLNYWQKAVKSYHPLPVDTEFNWPTKVEDMGHHSLHLNPEMTSRLLQEAPKAYHTEINDILLAALALTICDWSGRDNVTIGLEGHGREDIDPGIDTTRTIGWFTSLYPLLLRMPALKTEATLIQSIKEQLRQLPEKGIGYGVLKSINKEPSLQGSGQPWDIMFNYLGQLDNVVKDSKWLSAAAESQGAVIGDENIVGEKISVNSSVTGRELILSWGYSRKHYHEETIKKLSASYISNLENLINHCVEQVKSGKLIFTPSDYGLGSEIGYQQLDVFLSEKINGRERRAIIQGLYRLSSLQEGMLFHGLYDAGIGAYIEQFSSDLSGVEEEIFTNSWKYLMRRHSVLRSAFYVDAFSIPVQCVYKDVEMPILIKDYRGMSDEEQAAAIKAFDKADWDLGFDFEEAPLMRLGLLRLSEDKYRMLWTSHHILFDGWSFPILMEEFLSIYDLLSAGREITVTEEDRYEDYIRYIERSDKEKEEKYWRHYLHGIDQNTLLPFIRPTLERNKGAGAYQSLEINLYGSAAKQAHHFAQRHRLTLNTIMQGVWAYLLHCYTGNKNIVYGIIVSGRPDDLAEVEQRVGMYINTLPLHSILNEEERIVEWLKIVQAEQVNSRQYQHTPFPVVQGWAGVQGDLFDTLLTFENYPFSKVITSRQWALNVSNVKVTDHTNYPLSIIISSSENINIRFSYNTALLQEAYARQIRNHFENVLMQVLEKGNGKPKDLQLMAPAEQQQLLEGFNKKQIHFKNDRTIINLFEEQVAKAPNALAIVFNEEKLTYFELNRRSNQLAHYLKSKGVTNEVLVPLCLDRSIEMMTAVLGILKAGGAYVPIDPDFPAERIAYMLADTGASLVISNRNNTLAMQTISTVYVIEVDNDQLKLDRLPADNLAGDVNGENLAYVIYTSGSTGKPKGVMIEHKTLFNYLQNTQTNYIDHNSDNTGTYIHLSYTFDASITAMFMPLLSGKAAIIGSEKSVDVFEDSNLLRYAPYDFIKITPSHLELLQPKFKLFGEKLLANKLVIGGEALYPGHFNNFIKDGYNVEIINEYGPTEATVGCTTYSFYTLAESNKILNGISIGKPVDNALIYILNHNNNPVPIGVKGEICIGGAGLARGYLNLHDLTRLKFIEDPFSGNAGDKIYKTGDIGRWLPDGNIEYMGRLDDQVKIRGHRVELGEIEHEIQQCECVSQAVVLDKLENEAGKRLMSYYVPEFAALKSKERSLQYQRVANWKELYETEYGQTEQDINIDPEFNIIGWNDSFNGEAIPAREMKEWLDDIVRVVLSEQPENLLEIGCGTGLIYYQLAGKLKKYIGSDLSRSSINQIKQRINKGLRNYGDTELFTAPAHETTLQEGQEVDTILLNSIIQYFPGEDYMNEVIEKCMALIKSHGRIIIGDVRDNRLLELFKARLRLQKSQDSLGIRDFKWGLEQDLINEEELCFSPAYFYRLKNVFPQITFIDIQWKEGSFINELSLYRYTVVIYVGREKSVAELTWQNWNDLIDEKTIFSTYGRQDDIVAIKDVPNPRLWKEGLLQQALQNSSSRTVGDIMDAIEREGHETVRIKKLLSLAESKGYGYRQLVHEDPLKTNIVFGINITDGFVYQPSVDKILAGSDPDTNIPLFADVNFLLQKDIRELLQKRLPDYMVPSEFIALNQLPLTNNGKVDRLFLSQREDRAQINNLNYLPAVTDTEKALARIWKELLHLERVGVEDNFFNIGGHSLLAMRVISAIRKELEIELNIKELFVNPTISSLALHIQQLSKGLLLPSIEKADPRPAQIPLSFSQERIWFIDRLDGSLQYHMPAVLRLKGELDKLILTNALQQIVNRHEVLRTVIHEENGLGYQLIKEKDGWMMPLIDGSAFREDMEGLQQYIQQLIGKPFNLSKDYMLRAALIALEDKDHVLIATLHHIASDGWSTSVMVNELVELYNASMEHRVAELASLPIQFADYAIWQRKYLQGDLWNKKLAYWKDKLEGVSALQLTTDYPRPLVQSTNGSVTGFMIDKDLSAKLHSLSQQNGATLFMALLAAFNVLLYRYSGQEDICVGTPIAGRQQQELEGLIGFFVNTLALRSELDGNSSFKDLLQQVKATTLEAYMYQEVPFEKVVELVVKERDMSRSPLFQVMLALQNTPEIQDVRLGQLQLSAEGVGLSGHNTSTFELSFVITETTQGLYVSVEYCTDLFNEHTISQMAGHFKNLLASVVNTPDLSIGRLPMLSDTETHHLLIALNDTKEIFSSETVIGLIKEQVAKNPEASALVSSAERITYKELNERSNQLAFYLKALGVRDETLVPVCMKRSIDIVIAMLGILKAGGAYVPIDPDYPSERISYMLTDTRASLLLTRKDSGLELPADMKTEIIYLEELASLLKSQPSHDLPIRIEPQQLAYVIYTSGSTGKPKGVMIEHNSLANLVNWHNEKYKVTELSRATAMAGIGFDAFGWEIWPYLSCGAGLYIVDDDTRLNPRRLAALFIDSNISHSFIATALVQDFIYETKNKNIALQYLLTGGDKLQSIANNGLSYKLVNNYGPTENTVVSSSYELFTGKTHDIPPIGKPISNTVIYLLNEQQQLVPAGVAGELCIGGAGLARGYLNRPELTTEKFIPDPFNRSAGSRLYKSGDLCRWLPDGNLEFMGRIDEQVKIRGYRIEPGEVEHALQHCDAVRQVLVTAKEDQDGNKKLVCYIVAEGLFDKDVVVSYLKDRLPDYMIPSLWVEMAAFPLTKNGKIDRMALPDPDTNALLKNNYVAPRTALEEKLVDIWKDLLQLETIGVYDDFFELGGHSLLAMRMVAYIENRLMVSVPIKVLFQFTCVNDLSKYLETQVVSLPEKNAKTYKIYDI